MKMDSPPPAHGSASSDPTVTLEGVLDRILYANEETAWSVVRLVLSGSDAPVTAVGNLLGIQPGENIRAHGRWVRDRRFGEQFQVESYVSVQPATLVGIEKYLGSGLIHGIGKEMARRLVDAFGLDTLEVIENNPERLREVPGIGRMRSEAIGKAWREQRAVKDVMIFLQSHGVTTAHAVRIHRTYGDRAIAIVRDNPYRLAIEIMGIGFRTADQIARNLGIDPASPRRAEAGLLHVLGEMATEGHIFCPREELTDAASTLLEIDRAIVASAIDSLAQLGHVVIETTAGRSDTVVYLRSLHAAEVGIAAQVQRLLLGEAPRRPIDAEKAIAWFEESNAITLAPAQRDAVRSAIANKVLVITGGPGTGKTTLINAILRIHAAKKLRIVLAAPTGRAAKRLEETSGHKAKTIHRLLEFSPQSLGFGRNADNPLDADLVIVDEFSMVDCVLGNSLFQAIPRTAQVVVVGDVDQLPSVGAGALLKDFIESGAVPVVRLDTVFRQAERSLIVVNAHRVNRGEMPAEGPGEGADERGASDFYLVYKEDPEQILDTLQALVLERIPRRFGFDRMDDIQVLTPMHRGLLGASNLNAVLQASLNPHGRAVARGSRVYREGDKVLQVRNNYERDVFNGDIGRVARIDEHERTLSVRFDDRVISYAFSDLDELALAYACSIHKAQGSEYPCVVIPLHTQHYMMLQRNLLYTAITRGRRLVVLLGSRRALALAVKNARTRERHTRLAERLRPAGRRG